MNKAFTLIEILVVMAIIGILASVGLGNFQSAQVKARDSKRKAELNQVAKSLEVYFNDKKQYPLSSATGEILGCTNESACTLGAVFQDENDTIYMINLPIDPKSPAYDYSYLSADGTSYQLYARLENTKDGDVNHDVDENPLVYSGVSCGSVDCNYGVASTNMSPETGQTLVAE